MTLYYKDTEPISDVLNIGDYSVYIPNKGVLLFSSNELNVLDIINKPKFDTAGIYFNDIFIPADDSTVEALRYIFSHLKYNIRLFSVPFDEKALYNMNNKVLPEDYGIYRITFTGQPDKTAISSLCKQVYNEVSHVNFQVNTYVQVMNKIYMFVLDKSKIFHIFVFDPTKSKIKKLNRSTKSLSAKFYSSIYNNSKIYIYSYKAKHLDIYDIKNRDWQRQEFDHRIISVFSVAEKVMILLDNGIFYSVEKNLIRKKMSLPDDHNDPYDVKQVISDGKYIIILHGNTKKMFTPINIYNIKQKSYTYDELEFDVDRMDYDETGYSVNRTSPVILLYTKYNEIYYTYIFNPEKTDYIPTMFTYWTLPFFLRTKSPK